jgi:hypothetical protein
MHAEAIQILRDIEQRCDTAALLYRGISYWPLIRLRLWAAMMRPIAAKTTAGSRTIPNAGPSWPDVGTVTAETAGPSGLGLLRTASDAAYTPGGALFFARPEEYAEQTADGVFAKIIDSVYERSLAHGAGCKVELADARTMAFKRRLPSLYLDPARVNGKVLFDPPGVLERFSELAATVTASGADLSLDQAALTDDMGKIFYYARIFEKVLQVMAPRALVLSVYYHPVGMAWMLACRRAGVASIDLQHGRLGPIHGLYTHLGAAPADGYHLLPDRIWCWGEETRQAIASTLNPACTRHRGFVGGNAWMHKWRYGDASAFAPPSLGAFLDATHARRKILVSLQPYDSPVTPDLIQAMKQSPPDWLWLLRLHPLRRHTAPYVAAILAQAGVGNAELDAATNFPLFTLLRHVDHHVTAFSSVTVEAAAFGLSTSLTAAEGRDAFSREVAGGIARYTPDVAGLMNHIHEVLAGPRPPVYSEFMDMSEGLIDRTLDTILQ